MDEKERSAAKDAGGQPDAVLSLPPRVSLVRTPGIERNPR